MAKRLQECSLLFPVLLLPPARPPGKVQCKADFHVSFVIIQHFPCLPNSQRPLSWRVRCLGLLAKTEPGEAPT